MKLAVDGREYSFVLGTLHFVAAGLTNIFATKNNKTLLQTIEHHRYRALAAETHTKYPQFLALGLGRFLETLKASGDPCYKRFLNKYGDLTYCHFELADRQLTRKRGLYAYSVAGELKYMGRCRDSFGKRINQGYGKIHPKNCYRDGQATNCHLNALIAEQVQDSIALWLHSMDDSDQIEQCERRLIAAYRPAWNIQLGESAFQ